MESIGEKLREARKAKKLNIKDVVKDTNISPIYLNALEEENFDKFPSETYLVGFLRSYAEYLKLDAESVIQAYKGYKIGDSETPLEELTKPTGSSTMIRFSTLFNRYRNPFIIAGAVGAVILAIIGFRAIFSSGVDMSGGNSIDKMKSDYKSKDVGAEIENIRNLQLTKDTGIILVSRNEAVQFLVDNKEVVFVIKKITKNAVELQFLPGKKAVKCLMDSQQTVQVEGCPRDVKVTLKGLTENRAKIMVELGEVKAEPTEKVAKADDKKHDTENTSVIAQDSKNLKIVFEAEFVQKSFVEIYLDGTRRLRGFVPEGSVERWEATEYIQIKVGNAGGLKARINGKPFVFGNPGQVANKVISWKKDVNNPNLYHIVVKDW